MPISNIVRDQKKSGGVSAGVIAYDWRRFIVPVGVFLVITLLSATFGFGLVKNILSTVERIDQLKVENSGLQEKRDKLSGADRNLLSRQVQVAVLAVPSQNSSLVSLSAIRNEAFTKNVQVVGLKVVEKEGAQKGVRETGLEFELEGKLFDVMALIEATNKTAPIVKISKVRMLGSGTGDGSVSADLSFQTFWAEAPKNLPAATAPLETLGAKDQQLLLEIEKLRFTASRQVIPATPAGRVNPFAEQ